MAKVILIEEEKKWKIMIALGVIILILSFVLWLFSPYKDGMNQWQEIVAYTIMGLGLSGAFVCFRESYSFFKRMKLRGEEDVDRCKSTR